jgi:hypothetical protein
VIKVALIVLVLSAAFLDVLGLYWLVQAGVTGRAYGVRGGTADRATQPALFWLNVAALIALVGVVSSSLAWAAVASGVLGSGFRARHPVANGRDLPELPVARGSAAGCEETALRVCLVAVGAAPDIPVDRVAGYTSTLLGSPVGILDPIPLTRHAGGLPVIEEQRLQVGTGAVERIVHATYPMLWGDRDVTLLILTGHDLWFEDLPRQRYAFGTVTVSNGGGGFAIVSSARMDPAAYGQAADFAVLERRMQVLIGKYIAILRYRATPSPDPTSPVYNAVQSPADLDRMRAFTPPR